MFLLGGAAAIHYSQIGLALSHYDARAHLVVARRIFDSIVPGWQQIGAVWLRLPHVLDMLPVQFDVLYRTGAFAILLSVASVALAAIMLPEARKDRRFMSCIRNLHLSGRGEPSARGTVYLG